MAAQDLGDLLSGAAGAPVNRPQLNLMVAQSQARNGLVSAQTQDAVLKAQQAQEEQDAHGRLEQEIQAANPDMRPSEVSLAKDLLVSHFGNDPVTALKTMGTLKLGFGNPAQQTSGQQMVQGKVAPPVAVPDTSIMPPGSGLSGVAPTTTAHGDAVTGEQNALAHLHDVQANAGGYNPHAGGGPMDPQAIAFGAYMLYKTGKMPALGMGAGPARSAILSGAAQLGQREANGETIANPGFDTAIANGQDFTGAQRNINSQAGGPLGNQTRSINNVVGHLQLMENLFNDLQNGTFQPGNKIANAFTKAFGVPAPTNVQTAAEFIGPELTKILSANGSAGTGEERQGFSNTAANLANAPEQTGGAIHTLKGMLGRQLVDMALQYHGATGRSDFVRRYVAPDVGNYLEVNPEGGPPQGPAPSTSTTSSTSASPNRGATTTLPPQALAQLKEGLHTTFGNGQVWTLQNGKPVKVGGP